MVTDPTGFADCAEHLRLSRPEVDFAWRDRLGWHVLRHRETGNDETRRCRDEYRDEPASDKKHLLPVESLVAQPENYFGRARAVDGFLDEV